MLGIYCRISKKKLEGVDTSIDTQLLNGKELALELGLPFQVYIDEGISGTKEEIEDRPEFAKLISDIKKNRITAVYTLYQDRLERSPLMWQIFVSTILKNDCKFYSNGKLIDLDNPHSRFIGDIMSASSAMYARVTSINVKNSIKKRAEQGRFRGQLPYGYDYDDKNHIVKNEVEAKYVRLFYEWSLEGIGSYTIANRLNEMQIPTKYNKFKGEIKRIDQYTKTKTFFKKSNVKWRGNVVHDILLNPINKGDKILGNKIYKVPAIVSESTWQKTIDNFQINKKKVGKKNYFNYLLNGLVYCSHCERQMVGKKRKASGDNSYKCKGMIYPNKLCIHSRAINIYKFETFIVEHLFKSKDLIDHLISLPEKQSEYSSKKIELDTQSKKLSKLSSELELAYKRLFDPDFEHDPNVKSNVKLLNQKVELQKELVSNLDKEVLIAMDVNSKERIKKTIKDYTDAIEFDDLKKLIHSLVEKIHILHVKEQGKMGTFLVNIKYRGFDEVSTFVTNWFALKWIWYSKHRSQAYTQLEIEEDRENAKAIFEFNNIKFDNNFIGELKAKGFSNEDIERQNPWSNGYIGSDSLSFMSSIIELNENELLNFN